MILNLLAINSNEFVILFIVGFLIIIFAAIALIFMFYNKNNEASAEEIRKEEANQNIQQTAKVNTANKKLKIIIIILSSIIAIFLIINIINCATNTSNSDGNGITTRSAKMEDIEVERQENTFLTMNYILTPNVDIENLQLTFTYTNSDDVIITTVVKYIGDVTENQQYAFSITLTDLNSTQLGSIKYISYDVTGGKVPYFQ